MEKQLPQKGDIVAGKYQVERLLGSGGMGAVYQVTHRVTGKAFAIKWLLPRLSAENDVVQRFIREAQVAGRVDHPNIVEVYDVGQEGDTFYMVMELLHGESLAQRLAAKTRLSAAEICQILIPVARGLEAAHRAGVIHRDLKPDNIFLCSEEEGVEIPKLLDFGISKMNELTGAVTSNITRQGAIMGTPFYMAPEQMRGHGVDARTDVYALGVILYQALSGELPFTGETFADLLLKIVSTEPKPLRALAPDAPAALVSVVERALAREQSQRVESAAVLGQLLQPFAAGAAVGSKAPSRRTSSSPSTTTSTETPLATSFKPARGSQPASGTSRMVPIAVGATLSLVALGVGAWFVTAGSGARSQRAAASRPSDEPRLVRPLPVSVKPVQTALMPEPEPEPTPAKPAASSDEVLPTPHVTALEPSPEVQPVPVQPLAAAEPSPVTPPTAAAPEDPAKPLKARKKKLSEDPFAPPKEEPAARRRGPRSDDVSVEEFLPAAPTRRAKP